MRIAIELNIADLQTFIGWTPMKIRAYFTVIENKMVMAAKKHTAITFNHYICLNGKRVLTILFLNELTIWNYKTGDTIEEIYFGEFSQSDLEKIKSVMFRVDREYRKCNECGKWITKGKRYSYAGFVCHKCYNPKKHLPADSSG